MLCKRLLAAAVVTLFSGSAHAQTLAFSDAATIIRDCTPGLPCGNETLAYEQLFDFNYNAQSSIVLTGRGSAFASGAPGTADAFALPVLKARSTVLSNATSTALIFAFQGYHNAGGAPLEIAFAGAVDYTASGGNGFVLAGLAVTTDAVRDPAIGLQWLRSAATGAFTANCSTTGAIAVTSSIFFNRSATSGFIDTGSGTCGGGATFTIQPGQDFYVQARLLTFQVSAGTTDASHTFNTVLSPSVTPQTRAQLASALVPISLAAAVPEPTSWALLIVGFGAVGGAMRRRRAFCAA